MRYVSLFAALALAACSTPGGMPIQTVTDEDVLEQGRVPPGFPDVFARLYWLCGQAFEGRVASDDPRDADWAREVLTVHVRECSTDELRLPLHVGENRSRTWVLTRPGGGLRLKHDHRHEDGSEDVLTQYGGETSAIRGDTVRFPADAFSRSLFEREGIPDSMANVWSLTVTDTELVYELDRPNRRFEARFDLTQPVDAPPPPWGFED
jgi:hypothetical protein